jgi:hypothetical protein
VYASRAPERTALQVARVPGPQPLMSDSSAARPARSAGQHTERAPPPASGGPTGHLRGRSSWHMPWGPRSPPARRSDPGTHWPCCVLPRTGPGATKWKYSAADGERDRAKMQPKHTVAPRHMWFGTRSAAGPRPYEITYLRQWAQLQA